MYQSVLENQYAKVNQKFIHPDNKIVPSIGRHPTPDSEPGKDRQPLVESES